MAYSKSPHPAWDALQLHLKNAQPPPAELIRAAYLEHVQIENERLRELWSDCVELRQSWEIEAEVINPSDTKKLADRVDDVLHDHAERSPRPLLPRFPFIARIPGLRRIIR